jgi:ParB family chromosome partitioning protein
MEAGVGGLEDDRVARGERGCQLPRRHQDREVPRDDLRDHTERLVEVVRHRVVVDLAERALLRADRAREVTEVVDGQRDVGRQRLADRLAVLPALRDGQRLEVRCHAVGDLQEDAGTLGHRRPAPARGGRVRRVQRSLHVLSRPARDLREGLPVHRRRVLEVLTASRRHVLAADEVVVARLVGDDRALGAGRRVTGHPGLPPSAALPAVGQLSARG